MKTETRRTPDSLGGRFGGDRALVLVLLFAAALVRLPFLSTFDLVTYDGTYYVNQAKAMLGWGASGGAFPIGYPLAIAALLPVVGDGVRAAQTVSFLSGLGSVWILFVLGRRLASRSLAFLGALSLALTPLFIRLSTTTYSEPIFIFWVLLGLYSFMRGWSLRFGLAMGLAAMTRPEALGIFGALAVVMLAKRAPRRRLALSLGAFLALYAVNVVVLSINVGRLVPGDTRFSLLQRTADTGRTSSTWQGREAWADFEGREQLERNLREKKSDPLLDGLRRMPGAFWLLALHSMPAAVLLAFRGVSRRRLFLLAGFAPLVFYPVFSSRNDPRYVLPYLPLVILFAVGGLERIRGRRLRRAGAGLMIVSTVAGIAVNRAQLLEPVSDGFQWAKKAGVAWRDRLDRDDRVADRKPYFAFYANAVYETIPIAPYEDAVEYLAGENARLLVLHEPTILALRPALLPLLRDPAAVRGELRFRQAEVVEAGSYIIYEATGVSGPLSRRRITPPAPGIRVTPRWSPDGESIAYRTLESGDGGGVFVIPVDGGEARRVVSGGGMNDPLSWSPDSRQLALALEVESGNVDIAIMGRDGGPARRLTSHAAADRSPSWSADGRRVFFCSNRTGRDEIWVVDLESSQERQITSDGGNAYPAVSPAGDRIAWIAGGRWLVVMDGETGRRSRSDLGRETRFVPSWSPDGVFIAVTGEETGGGFQVYLLAAADPSPLQLTKTVAGNGMPSWSPDGRRMVVVTNDEGDYGLWILSGLEPYRERLRSPYPVVTFGDDRDGGL